MTKFIYVQHLDDKSKSFTKLFDKAVEYTKLSERPGNSSHSAIIFYKNTILGYGVNKKKTHPLQVRFQKRSGCEYLHAEIDALIKVVNNHGVDFLKHCSMIVCRSYLNGKIANSEPCIGCKKALKAFNLKKVYYS